LKKKNKGFSKKNIKSCPFGGFFAFVGLIVD